MAISAGSLLGPYELISRLGEGGMGEVWRARDTRLERSVAIKLLLQGGAPDPQLKERLAREARTISALAHPNICPLFDVGSSDGIDYLVMELLDGETLADRIARGPLPVKQAIDIATQIALGLDAAHRAGIVHRDLKPGNIMLTRHGARLLDFGLAKPLAGFDSNAPTRADPLTREGTIVGTVRYMAPEQLEGKPADARTDVFAFGLVLQEMLTGEPVFTGSSYAAIMAAILTAEPKPLRTANGNISPALERVVHRCLEKDPEDRWQSMRDLAEALRWSESDKTAVFEAAPRARSRRAVPLLIAALAVALIALASVALWRKYPTVAATPPLIARFAVSPPPGTSFVQFPTASELAVSPDGTHLALVALEGRRRKLYVRPLDSLQAKALDGTDDVASPFWSPDGKWIAFFSAGAMKKVSIDGGPVQVIANLQGGWGSWSGERLLIIEWGPNTSDSIQLMPAAGGKTSKLTEGKAAWDLWPSFLPDGDHFVFFRGIKAEKPGTAGASGIYVGSIRERTVKRILNVRSRADVRGDSIYYVRDGTLVKQKFDVDRLEVSGEPEAIAAPVWCFAELGTANFSISRDASVIAWQRSPLDTQLVWRDYSGRELGRAGSAEPYRKFAISPDGSRIAADLFDKATHMSGIWLMDVNRGLKTRVSSLEAGSSSPRWFHHSDKLVISENDVEDRSKAPNLAILALADGSTRRLMSKDGPQFATAITSDDARVIFSVNRGVRTQIEEIAISGGATTPLGDRGLSDERDAMLSFDDRWLAFQSDESGRPEVYVRPFKAAGQKIRISSHGGTEPQWAPDGKSLFYLDPSGMLMRAEFAPGAELSVSRESTLFRIASAGMMEFDVFGVQHYAVAQGDRILVREIPGGEDADPVTVLITH
jgi:Tol biopolymer transport system component